MNKLVECVPNFSEGRRPEVLDAIVNAITSVSGVYLLGREMDADHNRAVVTIVGSPEAIGPAAVRGVEAAIQHIDLTKHTGEHPRMGAADVIPFVPIRGVTLADCVEIARSVGREIAGRFKIPVFLYEAAAARPDRVNLENVRRGQFEGLREEISVDPGRKPDFGDARIHPTAGAVAVGARKPLIAYNINLHTPNVEIAKHIARRVRHSTGGFRYVKAMGVLLKDRNQAQVSMNLTDFEHTPVELVFETVQREAQRYGVSVAGSEIVGLVPRRALEHAAEFYLRVENFKSEMILENRLAQVMASSAATHGPMAASLRGFVDRVASREPVPAGGCVAALGGALGASLGQMAIRVTKEKKTHQQYSDRYASALERIESCASTLLELVDADAEAYGRVLAAYKLPKDSPEREKAIQEAIIGATEIPARTAHCATEALKLLEDLKAVIHVNVASDLGVGLQMLRSALSGAILNMRTNVAGIKDAGIRSRYENMAANYANYAN